jgi:hypothetical protein
LATSAAATVAESATSAAATAGWEVTSEEATVADRAVTAAAEERPPRPATH